jgi:heme A synthase
VTILIVLLQLVAAVVSSWLAWPLPVAVLVTLLALACLYTERRRWRWLLSQR